MKNFIKKYEIYIEVNFKVATKLKTFERLKVEEIF
jgi:hypothetical protein